MWVTVAVGLWKNSLPYMLENSLDPILVTQQKETSTPGNEAGKQKKLFYFSTVNCHYKAKLTTILVLNNSCSDQPKS